MNINIINQSPDTGGSTIIQPKLKGKKKLEKSNLIRKLINASNDVQYLSIYSN